ncbi:MAG: lamin tail domain-containing protein [Alphaproteobacteria bacterium]|nr:lamin tail domain-containing protein [Alphaproteobacteria bacterium]
MKSNGCWAIIALALVASPAALAADPPSEPGDVIITELMTEPSLGIPNYYGQWFELYNNAGVLLDLNGLVIQDAEGQEIVISGQTLLAPEEFIVLGVSSDTGLNGNIPVDIVYNFNEFRIDKTGDEIILYYGSTLIDEFRWTSAWGLSPSYSLQLAPQGYLEWANDIEFNWCDSTYAIQGSPGLRGTPGNAVVNNYCALAGQDNDGDGYSEQNGDCDDSDAFINPATVDGGGSPFGSANDDADCDGVRDDGLTDDDGDGYAEVDGDCNDRNANVNPSRNEARTLDGIDNDCNCWIDDVDLDGDTYPDFSQAEEDWGSSAPSPGQLDALGFCDERAEIEDCDDSTNRTYPGATETPYDGIDQDCDGADYCDVDADGYLAEECGGSDCDDTDPGVHPGAPDALVAADGVDNDCDGVIDSPDVDGDGWGVSEGDCDDNNPDVHPGIETDRCDDFLDNNCDGFFNEGCELPALNAGVRGGSLFCGTPRRGRGWALLALALVSTLTAAGGLRCCSPSPRWSPRRPRTRRPPALTSSASSPPPTTTATSPRSRRRPSGTSRWAWAWFNYANNPIEFIDANGDPVSWARRHGGPRQPLDHGLPAGHGRHELRLAEREPARGALPDRLQHLGPQRPLRPRRAAHQRARGHPHHPEDRAGVPGRHAPGRGRARAHRPAHGGPELLRRRGRPERLSHAGHRVLRRLGLGPLLPLARRGEPGLRHPPRPAHPRRGHRQRRALPRGLRLPPRAPG